jgi:hypothetical protein
MVMMKTMLSPANVAKLQAYVNRSCGCHQLLSCWNKTCLAALPQLLMQY